MEKPKVRAGIKLTVIPKYCFQLKSYLPSDEWVSKLGEAITESKLLFSDDSGYFFSISEADTPSMKKAYRLVWRPKNVAIFSADARAAFTKLRMVELLREGSEATQELVLNLVINDLTKSDMHLFTEWMKEARGSHRASCSTKYVWNAADGGVFIYSAQIKFDASLPSNDLISLVTLIEKLLTSLVGETSTEPTV